MRFCGVPVEISGGDLNRFKLDMQSPKQSGLKEIEACFLRIEKEDEDHVDKKQEVQALNCTTVQPLP
eukprot:scaffold15907_cov183-Amphora_coffeaeformis.AAC.1